MSPTTINGRSLGVAQNGLFTTANTDPIPGGRLWPEAALTWNAMLRDYVSAGGNAADFVPNGPNSSARSRGAQDYFWGHQPPAAARPYTSNHGWAIAVDVKTQRAAAWIMIHGSKYGWSHDEGARVHEWWHFRYVGTSAANLSKFRARLADPLRYLTPEELHWVRAYDKLRKAHLNLPRRRRLRAVMKVQRKKIWKAAHDSGGWKTAESKKYHRLQRYKILLERTR